MRVILKGVYRAKEGEGITRKEGKRRKRVMARPRAAAPPLGLSGERGDSSQGLELAGWWAARIRCGRVGSGRSWENLGSNRDEGSLSPGVEPIRVSAGCSVSE